MAERYSRISRLSDIRYSTLKLKTDKSLSKNVKMTALKLEYALKILKKLFFLRTHFFKLALKSYCHHAITKNSQKHIPKV